ncbi:hemerythrin domain-containing protein [Streptomyces sp. NPDC085540]|uniref:hemerythrin domain-containing protein n=1 Tax=Streptomyces sp. NPDC085540 TaxID=3365730 RepID=UPI0037CFE3E8
MTSTDLTATYAMHAALRRDLAQLDQITTRTDRDARQLSATAGWALFEKALRAHHAVEDAVLWSAMRRALTGHPKELALLEAMEAEHAAIAPLIEAIDAALAEPDADQLRLGVLVDAQATGLAGTSSTRETRLCRWSHVG